MFCGFVRGELRLLLRFVHGRGCRQGARMSAANGGATLSSATSATGTASGGLVSLYNPVRVTLTNSACGRERAASVAGEGHRRHGRKAAGRRPETLSQGDQPCPRACRGEHVKWHHRSRKFSRHAGQREKSIDACCRFSASVACCAAAGVAGGRGLGCWRLGRAGAASRGARREGAQLAAREGVRLLGGAAGGFLKLGAGAQREVGCHRCEALRSGAFLTQVRFNSKQVTIVRSKKCVVKIFLLN